MSLMIFFSNIGPNLACKIPPSQLELDLNPNPEIPFLELQHVNMEDVKKLIMNISDSKATGEDEIPVKYLKLTINTVAPIICHVINRNITTKIVPKSLKTAKITPLYKEGDRNLPSNYRLRGPIWVQEAPLYHDLYLENVGFNILRYGQRHDYWSGVPGPKKGLRHS